MSKRPKVSGAHANPRRLMTATPEEFARWDAEAQARGIPWTELVRQALEKAIDSAASKKKRSA